MEIVTFHISLGKSVIFQSQKRWLFPLFELEEYLINHPLDLSHAEFHDKVVGKAAALLMVRLGAGSVHARVLSKLAQRVLDQAGIPYSYETLVERIDCQTEELLKDIEDPEIAYALLRERAGLDPDRK